MKKNEIFPAVITGITNEGSGVTRIDGMAVFVPFSAIGDSADIRIEKVNKNYAFGRIASLLTPAPERTEPDCAAYIKCGGCCFRHITYEEELKYKRSFVIDALTRLGGLNVPVEPVLPSPITEAYRNKVQFPVAQENGVLYPGFYSARSHRVVRITGCCSLQPSVLNEIAERICSLLTEEGATAYNELSHKGLVRHILLRQSSVDGSILLCLVLNSKSHMISSALITKIRKEYPLISTIILNYNTAVGNAILSNTCQTVYGPGYIEDEICGVPVRLTALSFFQINHSSTERLYNVIKEYADIQPGESLIDLYCGAGTIGLSVSGQENKLYGIEIIPDAIDSASLAAQRMGRESTAEFICGDSAAISDLLAAGVTPDVIITDPPRKGCSESVLKDMISASPSRIVMVSCNASTLARDLKYLCSSGYNIEKVQPVDLFPRTKHVEAVCLLSRLT